MLKLCVFLMLIQGVMLWEQHDYVLTVERGEILSFHKAYIGLARLNNFKYNRTHTGINVTLNCKRDFGYDLQVKVQGYKFASNEYRLFPLVFTKNFCNSLKLNEFGLRNMFTYGNFSGCPMKKGTYVVQNWSPDSSKFPPYIPGGSYMMDIKVLYFEDEIIQGQAFATVTPVKDIAPSQ